MYYSDFVICRHEKYPTFPPPPLKQLIHLSPYLAPQTEPVIMYLTNSSSPSSITPQGTKVLRNGVRYKLKVVTQDGKEAEDFIHVVVVDSDSNEVSQGYHDPTRRDSWHV